jgi:lysophospholipase L1-like esterase
VKNRSFPFCLSTGLVAAAIAVTASIGIARADEVAKSSAGAPCAAPGDLARITTPLPRTAKRIAAGEGITIVALGSSSTAGAGASSPAASYPSRLAVELSTLFPRQKINVINRGANGEDAREMLARFDDNVLAEKPDLVLWQVGTNSVLRDQPLDPAGSLIHEGLVRLKAIGADVILIDPQFAPKVLAKADVDELVDLLAATAKKDNVSLFRRFAVMRHWRQVARIPFETFLSSDELHMNDWSYACIAKIMAGSIAEAATRSTLTAHAGPGAN